ncbi:MAG: enolase, partial [Candidatus Bathyarchaeia archaeon]
MKITDVETIVFRAGRAKDYGTRWGYGVPPQLWASLPGPERETYAALTRIATDEGVEGYCLGGVSERVRALLVGENPLDRERLWQWMYAHKGLSEGEIGVADMALWDLAGRLTKLPVHKLMGGCRERVKAYASTYPNMGPPEVYADHAEACKKQGYKAYKIHAYIYFDPLRNKPAPDTPSFPKEDVAVCRAVRERVGD